MSGFDNEVVVSIGERLESTSAQAMQLMQTTASDVSRVNFTGNPEGNVTANPSSLCHDPVSGSVYIKDSGTGNTGWRVIAPDNVPVGGLAYFSIANGDAYLDAKWLRCEGQILDQADYPLLFDRVGFVNGPFTNYLVNATSTSSSYNSSTYDGTKFVASGGAGLYATSTNGQAWTNSTAPTTLSMTGIVYTGTIYAAASGNNVLTSTDLTTWTLSQSGNLNLSQLAYGNSVFVTTNTQRFQATSTDGLTWITKTPQGSNLIYASSRLVNGSTLNCIMTSTDTTVGFRTVSSSLTTSATISDIIFAGGQFVCCSTTTSSVSTSTDGYTWTSHATGTATTFNAIAFGASVYVFGTSGGGYRTTSDFVTYTSSINGSGQTVANLAYGASKFASVQGTTVFTSTDGFTSPWTNAATLTGASNGVCIRFVNGIFIAAGGSTAGFYSTSTDAITWSISSPVGVLSMRDVIFANSLYLAGFSNGSVGTSTNAVTWSTNTTQTTSAINSIAFDGAMYYAGSDDLMQSSTDMITWQKMSNLPVTGAEFNTGALNFGNGLFLIGTSAGNVLSSTDGITWTSHATLTSGTITYVGGGNSTFFATRSNVLYTSTDLTTWSAPNTGTTTTQAINAVNFFNGIYLAMGAQGFVKTSTDAIMWDQVSTTITNQTTNTIASSTNVIAYVGTSGFNGYSQNTYPYDETTQFQLPTDNQINLTVEFPSNFRRALYIRAD